MDRGAGAAHAAIHRAGGGAFRLLRGAFGPDLPHGVLRHGVRHRAAHGGDGLQRRRRLRASAAACCSARWPIASAQSRCWSAACFVQAMSHRDLSRGGPARRVLRAVGRVRPRLWRRDAALCRCWSASSSARASWAPCSARCRRSPASAWRSGPGPAASCSTISSGYTWLHAGSFAIGLAAVAVALSFPTKRRPSLDLGRAARLTSLWRVSRCDESSRTVRTRPMWGSVASGISSVLLKPARFVVIIALRFRFRTIFSESQLHTFPDHALASLFARHQDASTSPARFDVEATSSVRLAASGK